MLENLAEDIKDQLYGGRGWNEDHTEYLTDYMRAVAKSRLEEAQKPRNHLSFSLLGMPCRRKLWYAMNKPEVGSSLSSRTYGTFLVGDILEGVILALASAAGYKVTGAQDELEYMGVKGHRDAVINGVTVDVKTTNSRGMAKFKRGELRSTDPFGYLSQLSSYVAAAHNDPLVTDKTNGAFVAVQKDAFDVAVDSYDLSEEIANKGVEIQDVKNILAGPIPEERMDTVPLRKDHPNKVLGSSCKFCEFKVDCWPDARIFDFSTGPVWMTEVVREPRVREIIRNGF